MFINIIGTSIEQNQRRLDNLDNSFDLRPPHKEDIEYHPGIQLPLNFLCIKP